MKKIDIIAGARPNFVKIAPLIHAFLNNELNINNLEYRLIHTGQHYDKIMSDSFFEELQIPFPHINLNCGGGTQAEQTAAIMVAYEKVLLNTSTDLVIVVGDVTSTMACSIVAKKLNIKVAHIEAGIRSFDNEMPEEINRLVTDSITDIFFTTSSFANSNLIKAGISENKIHYVGNIMIDTLLANINNLRKPAFFDELNLKTNNYLVLTLHRPSNVDNENKLNELISLICKNAPELPIIFPVHPRTSKFIDNHQLPSNLFPIKPLSYLEFNYLVKNSKGVITDSGGITEETTVMNIPCITLRNSTERPETVEIGSNILVGEDIQKLSLSMKNIINENWKNSTIPALWDGDTAKRIMTILQKF
jgi:UDP-N-acetylglucosamine 2-epimerase (non-hydrolysing)